MNNRDQKLLLLGFGDINQRLAELNKTSSNIVAVRRSSIAKPGIDCRVADVTDRNQLRPLLEQKPDQIVVTLSPADRSEQGYRQTYLAAAQALVESTELIGIQPQVVFVSSSSVYAQNGGERVDEQSPCAPKRYNGQVLLQAEQCLLESSLAATIVRFSGIYGPGRYRLIAASQAVPMSEKEPVHWTNRIHAVDCARALSHILTIPKESRQPVYLASDSEPVPMRQVQQWISAQLTPAETGLETMITQSEPSPGEPQTGKRCDNARLLESGFCFQYPGYRDGFKQVLADYKNKIATKKL